MAVLRVSDLEEITGLSMRYWQRRVAAGEVPGAKELVCGKRRIFMIERAAFEAWYFRSPAVPRLRMRRKQNVSAAIVAASAPKGSAVVYLIRAGEFAKIGFTRNMPKRIAEIQTGNHLKLYVAGAFPGSMTDETTLHRLAAVKGIQSRGEWYCWSDELGDLVKSYFAEKTL
jgi:hypothetical protein